MYGRFYFLNISKFLLNVNTKEILISKVQSVYKHKVITRLYNMAYQDILAPPVTVKGLTELDRELFRKRIDVPCLQIDDKVLQRALPSLKKYLLKISKFKPVQLIENKGQVERLIHLNPCKLQSWNDFGNEEKSTFAKLGISEINFFYKQIEMSYDNWEAYEILKAILPGGTETLSSYSIIGHIVHVNIREYLVSYKKIIGQVLLDKIPVCRTVVNKTDNINNTYRNFKMEVLCGDENMFVTVKENHCTFEFDFATVYWNPRLGAEHERILKLLKPGDILYDVFAGVGPFAIPAAKNKCLVLANDLNPESYKWLNHNTKINKIKPGYLQTFNKDGADFILTDLKIDMLKHITNPEGPDVHITMNLPALAVEFLKHFIGLYHYSELSVDFKNPFVHVYCFSKGEDTIKIARDLVEQTIGTKLSTTTKFYNVRTVSNNKDMIRVSFQLTDEILTRRKRSASEEAGCFDVKKLCDGKEQIQTENEERVQSSGSEESKI